MSPNEQAIVEALITVRTDSHREEAYRDILELLGVSVVKINGGVIECFTCQDFYTAVRIMCDCEVLLGELARFFKHWRINDKTLSMYEKKFDGAAARVEAARGAVFQYRRQAKELEQQADELESKLKGE